MMGFDDGDNTVRRDEAHTSLRLMRLPVLINLHTYICRSINTFVEIAVKINGPHRLFLVHDTRMPKSFQLIILLCDVKWSILYRLFDICCMN